jgi:hypothetical protein
MLRRYGVLIGLVAALPICALGQTPGGSVAITIVNCPEELHSYPTVLTAQADISSAYRPVDGTLQKLSDGAYFLSFRPLWIHSWIAVRVGQCTVRFPTTVLTGRKRSLLAFPTETRLAAIDARHWVAGELPQGVGSVLLASVLGRPYASAAVDDRSYYFELVGSGKYLLRFEVSPGLFADVPLTLAGSDETGQVVDITLNEIMQILNRNHPQKQRL